MFYAIFFCLWLVFNGKVTLEIVLFGLGISAFICLFSWKALGYSFKYDKFIIKNLGRIFKYVFVTLWEIIKANFGVLAFLFTSKKKIEPRLVYFKSDLKTDIAKTVLSNSITITPGTILCDVDEDIYIVHALDVSMSEGMDDSTFVHQLRKMEENM